MLAISSKNYMYVEIVILQQSLLCGDQVAPFL